MAHAEIERAGGKRHRAVGIERDRGQFFHWRRRDFQIIGHAQSAQPATLTALALAPRETFTVGELERVFGQRDEIAAVIIG